MCVCPATRPRLFVSQASNVLVFIYDPRSDRLSLILFDNHPVITVSTNDRITLYMFHLQLSARLREQRMYNC